MDQVVKMQSEICKTFSNPHRLQIIKLLCKKEMWASDLLKETGISKANLSQHMALLDSKGIVISERKGKTVKYRLADSKIAEACSLMQEVVFNSIRKKAKALKKR